MTTHLPALAIDRLSPGANLESYIQAVNSIDVLTAEEERELADKLWYQSDLNSARLLVMSHLRFVVHIARGYAGYGLPQADLIQEGNLGLMKAVKRFNPEIGVRLVSFAVHWIKAEIHEFILRNWRIVKVATTKAQRKLFFNLRSAKKNLGWLNEQEAQAIADDLGVSLKSVYEMEGRLTAHDMSFDLDDNGDDDSPSAAPVLYLEDSRYDPAAQAENDDYQQDAESQMAAAMEQLDPRSRDIIERRWLSQDSKDTLQSLADEYGVSAERIRQLEKAAMKKLKSLMTLVA